MIFTCHAVFVNYLLISSLNWVKFFPEFTDIFLSGNFHLPHNLFLSIQLSIQVFSFTKSLVYLVLKLYWLLLKKLYLSLWRVLFYFTIFDNKRGIFQLRFCLKKFCVGCCMGFAFLLIALNPHVSCFFFLSNLVLELSNFFTKLLLAEIKLPLKSLPLDFYCLNLSLKIKTLLINFL